MRDIIDSLLKQQKREKVDIYELEKKLKEVLGKNRGILFYKELGDAILSLEKDGIIERYKERIEYSRDPRIQTKYRKKKRINENEAVLKEEILTKFHTSMTMTYYRNNLEQYEKYKNELMCISDFLTRKSAKECYLTVNERSYELFGYEKFLSGDGRRILTNLGLDFDDLCCFETFEPFFHYGVATNPGENILIIENKDTFFSLKKLFLEGLTSWAGINFSMLIYGEGNKITKSLDYLYEINVPNEAKIYYFGDFDPEGIAIFNRIQGKNDRKLSIMPLFYNELWNRRRGIKIIGKTQHWNDQAIDSFLSNFDLETQGKMKQYLTEERYIPQEALNISILRSLSNGIKQTI
jgi:hypothetical protein